MNKDIPSIDVWVRKGGWVQKANNLARVIDCIYIPYLTFIYIIYIYILYIIHTTSINILATCNL